MRKGRRRSHEMPEVEPDELAPVDVDGVRTVAILTLLWAVAFVALAFRKAWLDASGSGWWLWTCLAGVGLGLLGLEYTRKRRDAIELALLQVEAAKDGPDVESEAPDVELAQGSPPAMVADRPAAHDASAAGGQRAADIERDSTVTRRIDTSGIGPQPTRPGPALSGLADRTPPPPSRARQPEPTPPLQRAAPAPEQPWSTSEPPAPAAPAARAAGPASEPEPRRPVGEPEWSAFDSPPASEPSSGGVTSSPVDDDEPLLETTLGGGRRARQYDMTEELDEITDGGGDQYRGRRARRSDSA